MIIPDTNLLLYAYHEDDVAHDRAAIWWRELIGGSERVGIPWVVTAGFVRISTSPRMLAHPITVAQSLDIVGEWFSYPHVLPLNPGSSHLALFSELLAAIGVGGNLVTDAHIAALAIEYQAEVHSNDSDFARFSGLRCRNPLQDPG